MLRVRGDRGRHANIGRNRSRASLLPVSSSAAQVSDKVIE
jgi:hypothetical protein